MRIGSIEGMRKEKEKPNMKFHFFSFDSHVAHHVVSSIEMSGDKNELGLYISQAKERMKATFEKEK